MMPVIRKVLSGSVRVAVIPLLAFAAVAAEVTAGTLDGALDGRVLVTVDQPTAKDLRDARPLLVTEGDFDEDGVDDIVAAFVRGNGATMGLWRGNHAAVYPGNHEERRKAAGSWLLPPSRSHALPVAPDWLEAGFLDGDRHLDLVLGQRGDKTIHLLSGRGDGSFRPPRQFSLEGKLSALEVADVIASPLDEIVAGVTDGDRGRVTLLGWSPAASLHSLFDLEIAEPIDALAVGRFQSTYRQIAVASGAGLTLIDPRAEEPVFGQVAIPGTVAMAAADLSAEPGHELALLSESGVLTVLSAAFGDALSSKLAVPSTSKARLAPVRLDGRFHDVAVLSRDDSVLRIFGRTNGTGPVVERGRAKLAAPAVDLVGLRLNTDALPDLVMLPAWGPIQVAGSQFNQTFTVNLLTDEQDANSFDGRCDVDDQEPGDQCSFPAAMDEANRNDPSMADLVAFDMPGDPPYNITLDTCLFDIVGPVVVDGTTEPRFVFQPIIEITLNADCGGRGLFGVEADNVVVRGLALEDLTGENEGFDVAGSFTIIEGNYIGFHSGDFPLGFLTGIQLTGSNNTVGGTAGLARNVISGNISAGINISGQRDNIIQGNYIGTDESGSAALSDSGTGIIIFATDNTMIGGNAADAENVISGHPDQGISLIGTADDNTILRNLIGTNAAGDAAIGNGRRGISISSSFAKRNRIFSNLISGNEQGGIFLVGVDTNIDLNLIGTDIDGNDAGLGNQSHGIILCCDTTNNLIGPEGNRIAHNQDRGIIISGAGTGNKLDGNEIFANDDIGIDLGGNGVTENDAGDADGGNSDNRLQNFPVITDYFTDGSATGILNSVPGTEFLLELFINAECDPSGNGEGQTLAAFAGATTDGSGDATWEAMPGFDPEKPFLTAIAINQATNDTSEFSDCVEVIEVTPGVTDLGIEKTVSQPSVAVGDTFDYTVTVRNNGPGFAADLEMIDMLPVEVSFAEIMAPQSWACGHEAGTVSCTSPGLAIGAEDVFTITVQADASGDLVVNTATISTAATDENTDNDMASACNKVSDPDVVYRNGFEEPVAGGDGGCEPAGGQL